jgi:putative Holliday junction resolvase
VRPLATLRRGTPSRDAQAIGRLCAEHGVAELVVGLPLDMDGGEGTQALETRAWAGALAALLGLPVTLRDERLTSERAEAALGRTRRGPSGGPPSRDALRARRSRIDREAAALLVRDELDARTLSAGGGRA